RRVRPLEVITAGLKWAIPSLMASFLLDSALWGRWVWPESQVLLFNTVANRSSEWGEMPFYWYFLSALPRALSGTALLIPIGLLRDPSRPLQLLRRPAAAAAIVDSQASVFSYLLPGVAMVCLYSVLPHKELRFIFPALPLFNLAAGVGMSKAVRGLLSAKAKDNDDDDNGGGRTRSNVRYQDKSSDNGRGGATGKDRTVMGRLFLCVVMGLALIATVGTTALAVTASTANYPGALALEALHRVIDAEHRESVKDVLVHVDAQAAMTGVSRFGQRKKGVVYSKQEEGVDFSKFDFVVTSDPTKHRLLDLFEIRETIQGFDGISLKRFWQEQGEENDVAENIGGRGTMDELFRRVVCVSMRDKMYVMARWFPPPPREDLV
ncbi:unnamed protein product, partial [Ectocarpus fasciculatus]